MSDGNSTPTIFVVSGATGVSGELVVRAAPAQFRQSVPVVLVPHVRTLADLETVVQQAAGGGTVSSWSMSPTNQWSPAPMR